MPLVTSTPHPPMKPLHGDFLPQEFLQIAETFPRGPRVGAGRRHVGSNTSSMEGT